MFFLKRNPVFYGVLCGLLVLCFGGLWYLFSLSSKLEVLKSEYRSKSQQYERYIAATPSPTRSNVEALERNYRELYRVYSDTLRALNLNTYDREEYFGQMPDSRAAWFYEINKFVAGARYQAASNGIGLPKNSEFGFDDYANYVPAKDQGERVHRQIVIMTSLLNMLFESEISEFISIERGALLPDGKQSKLAVPEREISFRIGPDASVSIPGVLESYPFRVTFSGQANSLRSFINQIASSDLPFAISEVEVDFGRDASSGEYPNLTNGGYKTKEGRGYEGASTVPIISKNTSLFTVTIEFIELAEAIDYNDPALAARTSKEESDA